MESQNNVVVDFGKGVSDTIYARYGESGRTISFKYINSNISEEEMTGITSIRFILVKSDNTFIIKDVPINERLVLDSNMCASSGIGSYEIQINNNGVILSGRGNFIVADRVLADNIIDSVSMVNGLQFPDDFQEKLVAGMNITIEGNVISSNADIVVDYNSTDNKPKINNIELVGNKTGENLGLANEYEVNNIRGSIESVQEDIEEINNNFDNYLPIDGTAANSSKLGGYNPSTSATENSIVLRNSNGNVYAKYYNQSSNENETPTVSSNVIFCNSDGYFRKSSAANIRSIMDLNFNAYASVGPSNVLTIPAGSWTTINIITGIPAGKYFGICYVDCRYDIRYLRLSLYNSIDTIYLNTPYGNQIMGVFTINSVTSMQLSAFVSNAKTVDASTNKILLIRLD